MAEHKLTFPASEEDIRKLRAGDRSKAWGLWLLLSLALWERAYGRTSS